MGRGQATGLSRPVSCVEEGGRLRKPGGCLECCGRESGLWSVSGETGWGRTEGAKGLDLLPQRLEPAEIFFLFLKNITYLLLELFWSHALSRFQSRSRNPQGD